MEFSIKFDTVMSGWFIEYAGGGGGGGGRVTGYNFQKILYFILWRLISS